MSGSILARSFRPKAERAINTATRAAGNLLWPPNVPLRTFLRTFAPNRTARRGHLRLLLDDSFIVSRLTMSQSQCRTCEDDDRENDKITDTHPYRLAQNSALRPWLDGFSRPCVTRSRPFIFAACPKGAWYVAVRRATLVL